MPAFQPRFPGPPSHPQDILTRTEGTAWNQFGVRDDRDSPEGETPFTLAFRMAGAADNPRDEPLYVRFRR
jgi:hypothetical protein